MRYKLCLLVVVFLFSCESKTTLFGTWKKTISPSLAHLISAEAKDSLENSDFFALSYSFNEDSSFVISKKGVVLQKGIYRCYPDSIIQFDFLLNEKDTEWYKLQLQQKDTIVIYSEFGSITHLVKD
ncbi:MAG: hypothetical protein ACPGU5_01480 [Lishizhenia sp.]